MSDDAQLPPDGIADGSLLGPVRAGNAFEETVARLLQLIRLGLVTPGDALPAERELAQRLEVSRDTVREAIRELARAGFLVSRRGRYGGTFVSDVLPPTERDRTVESLGTELPDLGDVLALREVLEVGAARAAAGRTLAAAQRELLWSRTREVAEAPVDDYRRLDARLHMTIAELSGIPSLVTLIAENRMRVNALLDAIPLLGRNIAHSNEQHDAVVLAVLAGDPARAEAAMREHLEGSEALLRGFLE